MSILSKLSIIAFLSIAHCSSAQSTDAASQSVSIWRALDIDNTLVIDSSKGRIIVEMRPEFAPKAIERIKLLAREKLYDGLQFHRVIAGFVAQTGNPNNKDDGVSAHPNLAAEFMFKHRLKIDEKNIIFAAQMSDAVSGLMGSVPFQTVALSDDMRNGKSDFRAWGAHCAGVASMGHGETGDSANSELFFMLDATRRLDKDYTVFGRIVVGMDVLKKLQIGEPPAQPDVMSSVRVLADIPVDQRPNVSVLSGIALSNLIKKMRLEKGADFSVCDVTIPAKVE